MRRVAQPFYLWMLHCSNANNACDCPAVTMFGLDDGISLELKMYEGHKQIIKNDKLTGQ